MLMIWDILFYLIYWENQWDSKKAILPVHIGSLIYNAPLEYADLILNGDSETYLKTVTEYKPLDS